MGTKTKRCTKCLAELSVSRFGPHKRGHNGLQARCRRCLADYARERTAARDPQGVIRKGTTPTNRLTAEQLADHHELTEGERMVVENALGALRVGDVTPDSIVKRYVPSWVRQIRVLSVVVARARG